MKTCELIMLMRMTILLNYDAIESSKCRKYRSRDPTIIEFYGALRINKVDKSTNVFPAKLKMSTLQKQWR